MINKAFFVFSKAAIARVLNIAVNLVVRVEKWWRVVLVIIKGQRPRFFSISTFTNHFADWRKEESQNLIVQSISEGSFTVENPEKMSRHYVEALLSGIKCSCEDFRNQIKYLEKPGACKHGYAVLSHLGFDRLSEYIEHHRWCT